MTNKNDIAIIRESANRVVEIAALPVQDEKKRMWRSLNALEPERPMVMIDQVCWNEINNGIFHVNKVGAKIDVCICGSGFYSPLLVENL